MDLPEWLSRELWDEFKKMRVKVKAPMTEYAEVLAIKRLEGFRKQGYNPVAIVEESIMQSWKGLFEPKGKAPCAAPLQAVQVKPLTLADFERATNRSPTPAAREALQSMKRMLGAKAGH